ncbi:glycosyltransferase [Alicyclobacillus tolerans]|uniref:tetratricopeptide repeat-containing glycosyltransferase n=1 Tax=Alicyclobacillus tolerans TaxID=90970 RepID=UPI001F3D4C1A|nr:glycosyltransferase [Alicyclobacillus tolerans]MCF8567760.1 glycosyltransferase [Alicyclobacillus tolerans]
MKLSLCAIVKDDHLLVRKMLDSVVDVVDEIVIADTGSTDPTIQIIEDFMKDHSGLVKLLHYEWTNDFAAARNFTIENATGDWILVLDADEFLDEHEKKGLRPFLEQTAGDGVFIKLRNYMGTMRELENLLDADICRVFRKGYTYEGIVHEQIVDSIRRVGGGFDHFSLHIHHIGYTREYVELKGKKNRNISLLEEQLRTLPKKKQEERWFAATNLLAEYVTQFQWDKVRDRARLTLEEMKQLSSKKRPPSMLRVFKFYIDGLRYSGHLKEAIRICKEATRYYPKITDLHFMQAEIYIACEEYHNAIQTLKVCRSLGDVKFHLMEYIIGAGTFKASRSMGYSWLRLGDDLSAREWYVKAFSENPEQSEVIPWIILLTPEQIILREMEKVIKTPQRYDEFIQYYSFCGYDDALFYTEKAENVGGIREATKRARFSYEVRHGICPSQPDIPTDWDRARLGLWYFEQQNMQKAEELWNQSGEVGEYYLRIYYESSGDIKWEMRNIFLDLLAVRATHFLSEFGPYTKDIKKYFHVILHTDLLVAYTSEEFLNGPNESCEEAEWKAQVFHSLGNKQAASTCLDQAYLPNGSRTVRGYAISSDVYADHAEDIVRMGRQKYPDSRLLAMLWANNFGGMAVSQGVVM